jgi:hypothetical protein
VQISTSSDEKAALKFTLPKIYAKLSEILPYFCPFLTLKTHCSQDLQESFAKKVRPPALNPKPPFLLLECTPLKARKWCKYI